MDNLLYTGLFRSPVSWAKVNRELSLAIMKYHPSFYVHEQKGFLFDKDFPLPFEIKKINQTPPVPYDDIAFIYPPVYAKLMGKRKFAVLTVESTSLPTSWKDALNKYADAIFVPSHFCRDVLMKNNVKKDIFVTRFGVNTDIFHPRPHGKRDKFRFLFVGTPHYRKGPLELMKAFKRAFMNIDNVELYMKFTYKPTENALKPWEIPGLKEKTCNSDNIIVDFSQKSDSQIADLIALSDVVVQPSYSEGFGLSILEAMAMKKLVITTSWSGETEFASPDNVLVVDSIRFRSDNIQYGEKAVGAYMQKPSTEHLSNLLKYSYSKYNELYMLRENAYVTAKQLTWDNTAKTILSHIY